MILTFATNISLSCIGFPGTNTVAYYENSYITPEKSFITLGPGIEVIKLFVVIIYIIS